MSILFGRSKYLPVINTLGGVRLQTSVQGLPVPIIYGRTRIAPNLIWFGDFFWEQVTGSKKGGGGGGSGKKGGGEYDYGAAVMLGLCQGPITGIGTVWNTSGNLPSQEAQETFTVPPSGGSYTVTNEATFLGDYGVTRGDAYTVISNDFAAPGSIILTGVQQTPMIGGSGGAGYYTLSGSNDATYNFNAGDAGKTMTITYAYGPPLTSGGIAQDPIATVGFTLFNGTQGQAPWSYLTSKHPSQAIGYTTLAYLATPVLDLGMGGAIPNFNFEIYGLLPFPGGPGDCDPNDVLNDIFTNSLYGCGVQPSDLFYGNLILFSQTFQNAVWDLIEITTPSGATVYDPTVSLTPPTVYSSGTTYSAGQAVTYLGIIYTSLINGNIGNTPSTSPSDWAVAALGAEAMVPTGGATNAFFNQVVTVQPGFPYTFSIWLKVPSGSPPEDMELVLSDVNGSTPTGIVVTSTWQQFSITRIVTGGSMDKYSDALTCQVGGNNSWTAATGTIDAWGAQLQIGYQVDPNYYPTFNLPSLGAYSNYCVANGLFISPAFDQERTASDWIRDLLDATNSELIESGGLLKVVPYGDTTIVGNGVTFQPATDPIYDLTADSFIRSGTTPPIEVTRPSVQDAYNSVRIEYVDRSNSYNPSLVEAQDLNAINLYKYRPEPQRQYHMFTAQTPAALCAATILARLVYVRNQYKFKLPQQYILLDPMDLVTVPAALLGMNPTLSTVPIRILTIDEAEDKSLDVTAEEFPWGTNGPTLYPKQALLPGGANASAPPGPINPPIIFEALSRMNNQIGHVIWFGLSGPNPNWGGCRIWISTDGTSYLQIATAIGQCQMGVLTAALPDTADPDTIDTLAVNLTESFGELDSYTAGQANLFASLCYIGPPLLAIPSTPSLSSVANTPGVAGTFYVKITYVGYGGGESLPSPEASITIASNHLLQVASPSASLDATGYNVYADTSSGAETLQNLTPIAIGTAWTMPTSGLISGTEPPFSEAEFISYQDATMSSQYNFNIGTLLRRGVYNSVVGSHPIGSNFMFLNNAVEGYVYDPSLISETVYFKFTSFNQSGITEQPLADVTAYPYTITGSAIGLLTPAHSSYRPSSNPLTAVDAGTSVTIDISAFDMVIPGQADVVLGSGSITGLLYSTLYYIYFSDPGFISNPSPTYLESQVKTDAIDQAGYMFVGSIFTPVSGGPPTYGNNDGGGGAQIGTSSTYNTSVASEESLDGNGTITNLDNALDGDPTTFATLACTGNGTASFNGAIAEISAPSGITPGNYTSATLNVLVKCTLNTLSPAYPFFAGVELVIGNDVIGGQSAETVAGGTTLVASSPDVTVIDNSNGTQTVVIPIPANTNISQVGADVFVNTSGNSLSYATSGTIEFQIYGAWIEVTT